MIAGSGIILIVVVSYFVITTLIGGWCVKQTKNAKGFLHGKGMLGPWVVGILVTSYFLGSASVMGGAEYGFTGGISTV